MDPGMPDLILPLKPLWFFLCKFQDHCYLLPACPPLFSHFLMKPGM